MRGGFRAWARCVLWLVAVLAVCLAVLPPTIAGTSSIAVRAWQVHPTIYIDSDANFTANATKSGVTSGRGTPADPYVIQGWNIIAAPAIGIWIRYTTASFVIRDVRVHDGNATHHEGIFLQGVSNGTIDRVTADGNREGIRIDGSNGVAVTASTLSWNQATGVTILNSKNVLVRGNVATGAAQCGISMSDVSNASVLANQVSGSKYGIRLDNVSGAMVSGNEAKLNYVGISLLGLRGTGTVTNNTLIRNSNAGLEATSTGPVDLTWNNVSANGVRGFYLYRWTGVIHHNHFGLYQSSWDADVQNWDAGYPTGGNWWADYRGLDRCSGPAQDICPKPDGFGDTPMLVDGGSRDRYPRIFADRPPTARCTLTPASPLVYEPVAFDASMSSDPDGRVVDFAWDFGDGVKASGMLVRHAFAAPGAYHVTLDIMDNGSGTDRAVQDLVVQAPVPVVPPLSEGQILLGVAFGPALIAFLVTAVLVGRMNRRKTLPVKATPPPRAQRPVPPRAPARAVQRSTSVPRPGRFCPKCGTPATKGSVCVKCGALLRT